MDGLTLGLDLCDAYTQLCCAGQDRTWSFPTAVCRAGGGEEWLTGEEAYARALAGGGVMVDKLLQLVMKGGTATIGGVRYEGADLLCRFLERVLALPGERPVVRLVVTVPRTEARLLDSLFACGERLGIPRERMDVISHTEAFVYYVLSQKREVWNNQVGMFDLSEDGLCYYEMKVQRGMRQTTVVAEREKLDEGFNLDILKSPSGVHLADKILCACGERLLQRKLFSSVFLTGKGFESQDWASEFMKMVCARRRVYAEPVLFAQGAAWKAADLERDKTAYPYVILCDGRLNVTVSIKVWHRDQESQMVLAAAGEGWYGAGNMAELILDHQDYIEFLVTPADPRQRKIVKLTLEGFPRRDDKTLRVRLQIGFLDENTMTVTAQDLGFGEFFPSSGASIRQEVRI